MFSNVCINEGDESLLIEAIRRAVAITFSRPPFSGHDIECPCSRRRWLSGLHERLGVDQSA